MIIVPKSKSEYPEDTEKNGYSLCIVCQGQTKKNSILCVRDFCRNFYDSILVPTETLILSIKKNQ